MAKTAKTRYVVRRIPLGTCGALHVRMPKTCENDEGEAVLRNVSVMLPRALSATDKWIPLGEVRASGYVPSIACKRARVRALNRVQELVRYLRPVCGGGSRKLSPAGPLDVV